MLSAGEWGESCERAGGAASSSAETEALDRDYFAYLKVSLSEAGSPLPSQLFEFMEESGDKNNKRLEGAVLPLVAATLALLHSSEKRATKLTDSLACVLPSLSSSRRYDSHGLLPRVI